MVVGCYVGGRVFEWVVCTVCLSGGGGYVGGWQYVVLSSGILCSCNGIDVLVFGGRLVLRVVVQQCTVFVVAD